MANFENIRMQQDQEFIRTYESLDGSMLKLTIEDLLERGIWKQNKADLQFKEEKGIPVNVPTYNETLYIRFIEA